MKSGLIELALLMSVFVYLYFSKHVTSDDIIINRYYYLKSNNSLFDGIIHDSDDEDSYATIKEGIPFGRWKSFDRGNFIFEGNCSTRKLALPSLLGHQFCDTILIDTYAEGSILDSNSFLTRVVSVTDVTFFSNDLSAKKDAIVSYCKDVAALIQSDTVPFYVIDISSDFSFETNKRVVTHFRLQDGKLVLVSFRDWTTL